MLASSLLLAPRDVASAPPVVQPALLHSGIPLSIGAPNAGRLVRGERLEGTNNVRIVPAWRGPDFRWGLPALVDLIESAARKVDERHPHAKLSVGDLSNQDGGAIRQHLSHQSGRDADIGFYVVDRNGKPLYHTRFVSFDGDGKSKRLPGARFDDARNWSLIEALLSDRRAKVQHIFVSNDLRRRLLHEAERRRAPLNLRLRAARVMTQPKGTTNHADHFHVRIDCPKNQIGICEPWPRRSSANRVQTRPEANRSARARGKRKRAGSDG